MTRKETVVQSLRTDFLACRPISFFQGAIHLLMATIRSIAPSRKNDCAGSCCKENNRLWAGLIKSHQKRKNNEKLPDGNRSQATSFSFFFFWALRPSSHFLLKKLIVSKEKKLENDYFILRWTFSFRFFSLFGHNYYFL